jgi:hypothetical protein
MRRHPVGVEDVEIGESLSVRREQDRPTGDLADGQRRTTAGVTVELGEHHPGEPDPVPKRFGGGHRILADHGVDHEQRLVRPYGIPDVAGLPHQLLVDAQAARRVDDDHVVLAGAGLVDSATGDIDRVAGLCRMPRR